MSEAPEAKNDPTIEEQQVKLEAVLKEAALEETAKLQEAGDAPESQVPEQVEEKEKVEIPPPAHPESLAPHPQEKPHLPPAELSPEEIKASLMELGMPELREYAKNAEIKIPFTVRSKEAVADFIVAILFQPGIPTPEAPEAGEAPAAAPEAPEAAEAPIGRLASSVEIARLLDEWEGHGPTVRQFQDLSTKIKALLP